MTGFDKKITDPQSLCDNPDPKTILFSMIVSVILIAGLSGFNVLQLDKLKSTLVFNTTLPFTQYTISNIIKLHDGMIIGISMFMVFWSIMLFVYYAYYKRDNRKAAKFIAITLIVLFMSLLALLQSILVSSSIYRLYVVLPDKVSDIAIKGNISAAEHLVHVVQNNVVASIGYAQLIGADITILSAVVAIFLLHDIIHM